MCKVKIKYLSDKIGKEVNPPFYATEGSAGLDPVSYTHLDVYKRQVRERTT